MKAEHKFEMTILISYFMMSILSTHNTNGPFPGTWSSVGKCINMMKVCETIHTEQSKAQKKIGEHKLIKG